MRMKKRERDHTELEERRIDRRATNRGRSDKIHDDGDDDEWMGAVVAAEHSD